MSYASWSSINFRRPLRARAWSAICAKARALRAAYGRGITRLLNWYEIEA